MSDRMEHVIRTFRLLEHARELRIDRLSRLLDLFERYGDHGSCVSGVEREHFPLGDKEWLRGNAHAIAHAVDDAAASWRSAGRRPTTFRRLAAVYRVEGVRY